MIRAAFSGLTGAWLARQVEDGTIPEKLAAPLTLIAARLPAPVLIAGAIGYGLYRLNLEGRARRAKDVTPERSTRAPRRQAAAAAAPRKRRGAARA